MVNKERYSTFSLSAREEIQGTNEKEDEESGKVVLS